MRMETVEAFLTTAPASHVARSAACPKRMASSFCAMSTFPSAYLRTTNDERRGSS